MVLEWEEKYSVGIQSIDNQHKEIFRLLNGLLDAMRQGKANNVISQIIFELEKYAIIHFQKEEFFFQRFCFEGAEAHIREHQEFIRKVTTLKSTFATGKIVATIDLFNFLKNWIEHHILVVDHAYADCFRKHGLK